MTFYLLEFSLVQGAVIKFHYRNDADGYPLQTDFLYRLNDTGFFFRASMMTFVSQRIIGALPPSFLSDIRKRDVSLFPYAKQLPQVAMSRLP